MNEDGLTPEQQDQIFKHQEGWQPCYSAFSLAEQLRIKKYLAQYDEWKADDSSSQLPIKYRQSKEQKQRRQFNILAQTALLQQKRENALMSAAPISAVQAFGNVCATTLNMIETDSKSVVCAQFTHASLAPIVASIRCAAVSCEDTEYSMTVASIMPPVELLDQVKDYLEAILLEDEDYEQFNVDILRGNLKVYLEELYTNMMYKELPSAFRPHPDLQGNYRGAIKEINRVMNIPL